MKKAMAFVFGAMLGGILGAVTALLLAPYSGDELRSAVHSRFDEIQLEIKEAAQKRREELEEQLQGLINPEDAA